MTEKEVQDNRKDIKKLGREGRFQEAFLLLRSLAERMGWRELFSQIVTREETYRYMLEYAAKGVVDPGRKELYEAIREDIMTFSDRLHRKWLKKESPELYFNTLRYEGMQRGDTIPELLKQYDEISDQFSLFNLVTDGANAAAAGESRKRREGIEKRLFDRIWVSFPLHQETAEAITSVLTSEMYTNSFKHLLLCAVILGNLQYHDEQRIKLMMDAYQGAGDDFVSMAALVGLLLNLYTYRDRTMSPKLSVQFAALREGEKWRDDVKNVFMELIRTRDTERITRKMHDEVIPQMLKLRPDISKKFNNDEGISLGDLEENPEWQELLDKSGIADKLKEISEMQEDGADVFMATFSHLKSFPFFNDISNWFRLFQTDNSAVKLSSFEGLDAILDMIAVSPIMCNGDKFSFALSVGQLPESQRNVMTQQLQAHSTQILEMRHATEGIKSVERKGAANIFIQDLYRFFKLFRRKGEFADPFNTDLNLIIVPLLKEDLADVEIVGLVAEFYFKRRFWAEALGMFKIIAEDSRPSAQLFQKLGYCMEKSGDIDGALKYYEQAELINGENHWTMRRLAACHRLLVHNSEALDYYQRLAKFYPEDVALAMNIGHTLLEAGREKEAAEAYFKADFLSGNSSRAWRPLAWTLLKTKDFAGARKYYERILSDAPTAEDYLNMGHLELAENNFKEAVDFYKFYIDLGDRSIDDFIKAFSNDKETLVNIGVDTTLIPLVIDTIIYSFKNNS